MTTPDERLRALKMVNDFLFPAVFGSWDPHDYPQIKRIPQEFKELARRVSRHYPSNMEIDMIVANSARNSVAE